MFVNAHTKFFNVAFGNANVYKHDPLFQQLCLAVARESRRDLMKKHEIHRNDARYIIIPGPVHESFMSGGIKNEAHLTMYYYNQHWRRTWVSHLPYINKEKFDFERATYSKK
ncbi:hypothetical protein BD410DRAFT_846835 [Rickenella mellea]|uniref:Uncharacterized protein n=1 Tax=Rickenella mellea TaxID=50990 RepID=A0A4Y7PDY3_9AGAM|nr:hypothetical protein BD410DRAFT_846835 [Rickenella mellea]